MWRKKLSEKISEFLSRKVGDRKQQNFPTLKSHPAALQHAEEAMESRYDMKKTKKKKEKEFKIYRWSPESESDHHHPTNIHNHNKPFLQSFFVDLSTCGPMVHIFYKGIIVFCLYIYIFKFSHSVRVENGEFKFRLVKFESIYL